MIIIETDLDIETAKERFLENVCKKPIWLVPISVQGYPIEFKKWKDKAFGGIDGNKIWFDNSGLAQKKGATKHEFSGTIEEKNGKVVISGDFASHYDEVGPFVMCSVFGVAMIICCLAGLIEAKSNIWFFMLFTVIGILGAYDATHGYEWADKKAIDALCEIFETTRVYNDEDGSDERDNGQ